MSYRAPQCPKDEGGFTLIELLVVILIIGILAAIAIPSFLSQKSKANDAAAKSQIGTLLTTITAYATENNGSESGATIAALEAIEPTLKDHSQALPKLGSKLGSEEYELESTSAASGDVFKLIDNKGEFTRTCTTAGVGGCNSNGSW